MSGDNFARGKRGAYAEQAKKGMRYVIVNDADDIRDRAAAQDLAVAQGNHVKGYRGVIFRDWGEANERIVARCIHAHPTTGAARSCVGSAWFQGHDIDNIELVEETP